MGKKKSAKGDSNLIADNRKARHEYTLEQQFEAGIVLEGWEVKSLRASRVQIQDSHVIIRRGEAWWLGAVITPLSTASTHIDPQPTRTRKLLLHRTELAKLIGAVERKGYTIVPTKVFWSKGRAKLNIALAKGKKAHDKRASSKDRDWQREKGRILKRG